MIVEPKPKHALTNFKKVCRSNVENLSKETVKVHFELNSSIES